MITVINTIALPRALGLDEAKAVFRDTAPRYARMPGLIRKTYFLSEDGRSAGGIYLWESRQAADACYTDAWKALVRDKYGAEPILRYLQSPLVVDNLVDRIIGD